jgi:dimethylaniline monooxygenase (N-oxide forming)
MRPAVPLPTGIENSGVGDGFYRALRQRRARAVRAGVDSYAGSRAIRLDTGEQVDADVIVFATGWRQDLSFLDPDLRAAVERNGRFRLYRHVLPPGEPHLGFVGYASSIACPLTSEIAAHWLSQCFRGELALPGVGEMEREIDRVHGWAREVFPDRHEGFFIGPYIAHYADDLMRDMGLRTRRTRNVLVEYAGPFWAERYRDLTNERRRARTTRAAGSPSPPVPTASGSGSADTAGAGPRTRASPPSARRRS